MWKNRVLSASRILVLLLSLVLVADISNEAFENRLFISEKSFLNLQAWVCAIFLIDFFIELLLSDSKIKYIKGHWFFFLVSIPYLNIKEYMGLEFTPEVEFLVRFIPLIRGGYALSIIVGWITKNKASSLLLTYLLLLFAVSYFASLIFYIYESGVNPMVKSFGDALWWAAMDMTTVGSNIYAITTTGKVLSVLLAAWGMMSLPILTVYITDWVQKSITHKQGV